MTHRRQRLRSASSSPLIVGHTRLFIVGDRAFPVAAARIWNSLPLARHFCTFVACLPVTPQDSSPHHFLSQFVTVYSNRAVILVISDTLIVYVTYLLTYICLLLRSIPTSRLLQSSQHLRIYVDRMDYGALKICLTLKTRSTQRAQTSVERQHNRMLNDFLQGICSVCVDNVAVLPGSGS